MHLFLLFALLAPQVFGCGFTVHQVISERAIKSFYQPGAHSASPRHYLSLLNAQPGARLAGAPFPDYLYQCGSNHDDGEYTHWSQFQVNSRRLTGALEFGQARTHTRPL